MEPGTYCLLDYEARTVDILREVVNHGFGEVTLKVNETKNLKTRILIVAGKSWSYIIHKDIKELDGRGIL